MISQSDVDIMNLLKTEYSNKWSLVNKNVEVIIGEMVRVIWTIIKEGVRV